MTYCPFYQEHGYKTFHILEYQGSGLMYQIVKGPSWSWSYGSWIYN